MVYQLLTELDKRKIKSYRKENIWGYSYNEASIEHLLRFWNTAKSLYLEELFGDQLIITRPIEFKEGLDETETHVRDIFKDSRIRKFYEQICNIYRDRILFSDQDWWGSPTRKQCRFVCNLFDDHVLAVNKITDHIFPVDDNVYELPIKDTVLKVQRGMKPIRIITKIANAYNIGTTPDENGVNDLEYFRRRHSLSLNQKLLKGELCLSIHPLDYMTMSDNDEGWESCMSWINEGEYRQGTVEMMNSPCVIVAYLSAGSDKYTWGPDEENRWNSKKWRSLFVVDRDFIINIKSYPYENGNLVKEVLKELAKLSGWGEVEPQRYVYLEEAQNHRRPRVPVEINGRKIALDFVSHIMYNDFGRTEHYIALNPNHTHDIFEYSYNYSGQAECMWCGEPIIDYVNEQSLDCLKCNPQFYCQFCEEYYDGDNKYTTDDGEIVCEYCWENHTSEDFVTNRYLLKENMERIYLSTNPKELIYEHAIEFYVEYDNIGSSKWYELFKIDAPRVGKGEWQEPINYILVSDCEEKALEKFELYTEEDIKDYLDLSKPY